MAERQAYQPQDTLSLWWLGEPELPRLIGELRLAAGGRAVALQYAAAWLTGGFALSEDLPLRSELFVPAEKDSAAGAVDDARPDRWGERVIRKFERSPRLSILEYLLFAGDDRSGALGVSLRSDAYLPWPGSPVPGLANVDAIAEVVRRVLADEPVEELQRRLIRPGVSFGGMRPKALVAIEGEPWLVKFSAASDEFDMPLIEHATMTLAAKCGIAVAATRLLPLATGHAVAIRRFDRLGAQRVHVISAQVALRAAGERLGYPQLAQLLRRLAPARDIAGQQAQLFCRMVFNILMDNTDDHEKNHALLRQANGHWLLAPAYDVLPSAQGLSYQSMEVGDSGTDASLDNALSQCQAFGLSPTRARALIEDLARHVEGWQDHFRAIGATGHDIALVARYVDGERLGAQRRAFAARRSP